MEPSKDQRKKKKLADDLVEYRQAVLDQAFVLQSRRMRVGAGLVKAARAILCTMDMVHTLPERNRALFDRLPVLQSRISATIVEEAGCVQNSVICSVLEPRAFSFGIRL